ncbi:uncharacterized protein ACLA_088940 [Aspergillus clavatus NRRL 1]|uniref:Uncharacterized protein n=1 Tax=Aspergillus clavatus (strain ATCC 1007 / CBS 513.65 / DSM 816 / NCTC 3887 / NRRL 1 / QM 1276 / 107) TaxID=344612 RepID=A1CEA4_ASPCL|nr:uncharacterized protein ACLA_088940 [Aspergillus clavatus NRRL 1]EAW11203.1 conserved hypothetical protein [Aspergillus clavatus NRRL 1]
MSFLSGLLCGCFAPKTAPRSPSAPVQAMAETHPHSLTPNHFPYSNHHQESPGYTSGSDEDGYTTPVPLPRYTPRPLSSAQEKTLEAHMRDPPLSSARSSTSLRDEKDPRGLASNDADELTSDASSAISFPSSYGNTSTATRETPPPPYSPAPSRAMSISSLNPPPLPPPPPLVHLAQPRPVARRADSLVRDFGAHGRVSFEDQHSLRSRRLSWESR